MLIGIDLLSIALWRAGLYPKWLSAIGAAISALALAGLAAGVYGPYWCTFSTTGTILMSSFIWELILGIAMLRHKDTSASVDLSQSDRAAAHQT